MHAYRLPTPKLTRHPANRALSPDPNTLRWQDVADLTPTSLRLLNVRRGFLTTAGLLKLHS